MLLIKNATILNFNPAEVAGLTDILIDKNKIIKTGKNLEVNSREYSELDANGRYVSPGLVCSHNHFYSVLARGIMANIKPSTDFVSVLENLWWRLDRALDEDTLYYSGMVGALEAIKCGTTSVIDHNASPSFIKGSLALLKSCFLKAGLRGILAYEITDRNGIKGMQDGLNESIDFIEEVKRDLINNPDNFLIESAIGGHAPFTMSDKTLGAISEALPHSGRGIHFHVAEDMYDSSYSHHHYGKDVLTRLEDFNLLNEKGILVHGVHLTDNDINILNSHNSFLVHNTRSNMNNSVGYMNKLHKVNNRALGTDGIGSNMLDELKFAFFKNGDAKGQLGYSDILNLLYSGNELLTRYFNMPFGKIEEGNAADLVIYDYDSPTPLQKENLAGHLIFGFESHHVESVIINGKFVYENKSFTFDTSEIYRKSRLAAKKLWHKMDAI